MADSRRQGVRIPLSDVLTRRDVPEKWNEPTTRVYEYTSELVVVCPRCNQPALIEDVGLFLDLSCGCSWHRRRGSRRQALISIDQDNHPCVCGRQDHHPNCPAAIADVDLDNDRWELKEDL